MRYFKNKDILVTGGAGSIGRAIVYALVKHNPKRLRILDQNETALFYLQQSLREYNSPRYFVGDIRDKDKVAFATKDVDIIIHCAALKHVPSCEYNPSEAVSTNVIGLNNIINAAKENKVEKCIYISTDKAVNPQNIMGVTKLLGEKLISNATIGITDTKFATVRFGNVLNSNGSVIPLFKSQILSNRPITVTHPEMTRFFMSIRDAANLVLKVTEETGGRETYILKMKALKIIDLASVLIENLSKSNTKVNIKNIGIRPGEKLYELLLTEDEVKLAENKENMFILKQQLWVPHYISKITKPKNQIKPEEYDSRKANHLSKEQIKNLLKKERII